MTQEQSAAYVQAMAAVAIIEALALFGEKQGIPKEKFDEIVNRHGVHHNAVLQLFADVNRYR